MKHINLGQVFKDVVSKKMSLNEFEHQLDELEKFTRAKVERFEMMRIPNPAEKALAEQAAKLGSSYIKAIQTARRYIRDQNISHLQKSHQLMIQMRQSAEQMVEDAEQSMGKQAPQSTSSTALQEVVNEVESMISTKEKINVQKQAKADIEPRSVSFNIKKKNNPH